MAKHKNHLPNEEPLAAADIPDEFKTMPTPGPLPGLTDAEAEAYLDAIGDDDETDLPLPELDDEPEPEATPELPRVIVAASSSWMNHAALERELFNWWHANNMVPVYIQIGDCPIGGEPMAIQSIKEFGLPFQVWNADTITPAQRDRAMVAAGADIAFIFLDEDSEGASRVRDLCIGAGIPTIVTSRNVYRPHRRYEDQ